MDDIEKKILRTVSANGVLGGFMFWCPGCGHAHLVVVDAGYYYAGRAGALSNAGGPVWDWNRSTELPTFNPSILVTGVKSAFPPFEPAPSCCHSFVRNGRIEYLGDCTHALAGKTVLMEPF